MVRSHTRAPSRAARGAGFTLVELVLVMAVIGLLAAVSAPRFFEVSGFRERIFHDEVAAAVRHAQKLAVASGCEVEVTIAGGSFSLAQRTACDTGAFAAAVTHPGSGAPGYAGAAPAGLAFSADVSPFRFDALGRARDAAGTIRDVIVTVGARTLRVTGETGFVAAQ